MSCHPGQVQYCPILGRFCRKNCLCILTKEVDKTRRFLNSFLGLMEQHIFCIFIDYRGHHRKGVAIYVATWVNLHHKLWFHWTQNVFLNTAESFEQEKLYLLTSFLPWKYISVDPFRAAPYMLMLVLHKDVLFQFLNVKDTCADNTSLTPTSCAFNHQITLGLQGYVVRAAPNSQGPML